MENTGPKTAEFAIFPVDFFETFLLVKVIAKCIGYISHCNSGRSYRVRIRICIIILSHAPPGNFAVLRSQLWQRVIRLRQHTDGCYILPEFYQTVDLVRASIEVTWVSVRLKDDLEKKFFFVNKLGVSSQWLKITQSVSFDFFAFALARCRLVLTQIQLHKTLRFYSK